jgi:hypothetical protein
MFDQFAGGPAFGGEVEVPCCAGLVVTLNGRRGLLATVLPRFQGFSCILFTNDYTPQINAVLTDFIQPTWSGYGAIPLNQWSVPFIDVSNNAETDHPPVIFARSDSGSPVTVYGYAVIDAHGYVWWAERHPRGAQLVSGSGGTYPVYPRFFCGGLCGGP